MTLVCDVMATCLEAAVAGRSLDVASSAERPAPLPSAASAASFDGVEAEAAQGAEAPLHRGEHAVRRDPRHEAAEHLARAVVALGVASRLGHGAQPPPAPRAAPASASGIGTSDQVPGRGSGTAARETRRSVIGARSFLWVVESTAAFSHRPLVARHQMS